MQEFQKRVVDERDCTQGKIDRLVSFISGEKFASLPADEQSRLKRQLGCMTAYCDVLNERVAAFS